MIFNANLYKNMITVTIMYFMIVFLATILLLHYETSYKITINYKHMFQSNVTCFVLFQLDKMRMIDIIIYFNNDFSRIFNYLIKIHLFVSIIFI